MDVLLLIDLTSSLERISRDRLLSKLSCIVENAVILNLVKSFLSIKIVSYNGDDCSLPIGIPQANLITSVLLFFVLDDFDRWFVSSYPYRYARFYEQGVIALPRPDDSNVLLLKKIESILRELHFAAKVTVVVRGGLPIPCRGGRLFVDEGGQIYFIDQ